MQDLEKLREQIGADDVYDDGTFEKDGLWGLINIKNGEIIKEPFADFIYGDGIFKKNKLLGIIDIKTGKIIEEAN